MAGTSADVPVVLEVRGGSRAPIVRDEAIGAAQAMLLESDATPTDEPWSDIAAGLCAQRRDRPSARGIAHESPRCSDAPGDPGRAAALLAELVATREPTLRLAAVDALGTLGQDGPQLGADEALLEALAALDPVIRLHAAVALSEAGGPPGARRARVQARRRRQGRSERQSSPRWVGPLARGPGARPQWRACRRRSIWRLGPERDALLEAIGRAQRPIGDVARLGGDRALAR